MSYGFTFRLNLASGEDIGTFQAAVPDWKIGTSSAATATSASAS